jgi:TPR repeat protein
MALAFRPAAPKGYVGSNGRQITATSKLNRSSQSSTSMARRARPDPKSAASLFDVGDIADPDYVTAMQRARMAAEAGSGEAQAVLAFILSSGPEDMRDLDEANLWYERSAAAGCPQGTLGHALALNRKGGGETVQRKIGVQLGKAAVAGLPAALYLLGVMSERGLGVTRNEGAAAEFYRRAAEKGHRSGQARWGKALMHGIGVNANPSDGETWLRRAALAGDPEAARCARRSPCDRRKPAAKSCGSSKLVPPRSRGRPQGRGALAWLLYFAGAGVPHDPEQGMQWFRISASAGDGARRARQSLAHGHAGRGRSCLYLQRVRAGDGIG